MERRLAKKTRQRRVLNQVNDPAPALLCQRKEDVWKTSVLNEEFPWLSFNAEENVMICDLCCAYPSAACNTDFLKGCSNFKKETIRKHAISNGHICARDRSLSKEKLITESQSGKKWKQGLLCCQRAAFFKI